MGERYTVIAYGVQNPPVGPNEESWLDFAWSLHKAKTYADLVALSSWGHGIQIGENVLPIGHSYEADPDWLGIEMWQSSEGYESETLTEVIMGDAFAEAVMAWERFRQIVQAETGTDLGDGTLLIATDHT